MTEPFLPENYFDLSEFEHKAIFDPKGPVWKALNNLKDYITTLSLGSIQTEIPSGAFLVNPETITIAKGTIVEPGAYIKGPCYIGEGCVIRHGAYIRGYCLAGSGCIIGHETEVKHAIFLNGAKAAHFAYVGDSILGNGVNLGAGTKCANLRFNSSEIYVQNTPTGLYKFGAIIGDGAQTGCNTVCNPGTLMGKGVFCYPTLCVGGVIPEGAVVKPREKPMIEVR